MGYGIKLLIWGEYACFTRPEMKVERVTYDVITPSAARGILEAIYWKPEMRWIIRQIHVLSPIRFTHVRRNEVKGKIPSKNIRAAMKGAGAPLGLAIEDVRQQRAAMILADVRYGIEAHVEVLHQEGPETVPEAKHLDQFRRRAERGACFHHPYFGVREFPASFQLIEEFPSPHQELMGEHDLGRMLLDIAFVPDNKGRIIESNKGRKVTAKPRFFHALMRDGVIEVPRMGDREEGS